MRPACTLLVFGAVLLALSLGCRHVTTSGNLAPALDAGSTAPPTPQEIGPARPDGPHFDHKSHMDKGLECSMCHGEEEGAFMQMPELAVCMECHEEIDGAKPPEKRAQAFYDEAGKGRWLHVSAQDDEVIFDHKKHVQAGAACAECHAAVLESATLPRTARLPMAACMECHGTKAPQYNRCEDCHRVLRKDVEPASHDEAFRETHGKLVGFGALEDLPDACAICHEVSECAQCHRETRPKSHGPGFLRAHGRLVPEARLDPLPQDCALCHVREGCDACHRESKPQTHAAGWLQEHGRRARHGDLDPLPGECALCHARSDCDLCHKAEMPRSHNNLWRLHGHAAAASIDRDRCTVCHTTDSCFLCHRETVPRTHRGAWGSPFNRHCNGCHLPLERFGEEGCAVCHAGTPSHLAAPPRPPNAAHMTMDPVACRECHTPPPHADNGQSCLLCHQ